MQRNFPLFQSHLDLAHSLWEKLLQKGDCAIDATCGAGFDTCKLAEILRSKGGGQVIGLDIQQEAIDRTRALLSSKGLDAQLLCQSHADLPLTASPVRLIVYNLGYLPKGDKQITTLAPTTLESLRKALLLLAPGGAVSITCYPGHPEGAVEEQALIKEISCLPPDTWSVCSHAFLNRAQSPRLLLIQRTY